MYMKVLIEPPLHTLKSIIILPLRLVITIGVVLHLLLKFTPLSHLASHAPAIHAQTIQSSVYI